MRNPNTPTGFTIVELLVAAAVFATVIVVVIDLFLLFLRADYEQEEQEQLEQSISYVFYQLSSSLHSNQAIDFSRYDIATNPNPQTELYTKTTDSFDTGTYFLGTGTPINEKAGQIYYEDMTTGSIDPITPDPVGDIYVDSLEFIIYPSSDPADVTVSPVANNQPAVVLRITAHVADSSATTATYQSLITSRYYVR